MAKALSVAIIDDDRSLAHLLSEYLVSKGMMVNSFACAEDFFTKGPCSFDAVILDLHLPGMWGSECVYKLRHSGYAGPVIAITGFIDDWDEEDLSDLGFDRIFSKPFDPKAIADSIGECVEKYH